MYHSIDDQPPPKEQTGVYACRVDNDSMPGFHVDKFFLWYEGRWCYLSSDQTFRGKVHYWVGPIPRTRGK